MSFFSDIFRTIAPRLLAVVVLSALALGVRAQMFIGTHVLKITPVTAQIPVEEEEEHRHDAKGNASAADRRQRDRVPLAKRVMGDAVLLTWGTNHRGTIHPVSVLPYRESDLRNGIGAPLRC